MPTYKVTIKGRVLFQNHIPVGNASVEVFDEDTVVSPPPLPGMPTPPSRTRTDSIGTLLTNENGWFENSFDFALGDLPKLSVTVSKNGRSQTFSSLIPGSPDLVTSWAGPKLCLFHEDPNQPARQLRHGGRTNLLRFSSASQLNGSPVTFAKPIVSATPIFASGTPVDVFAVPHVMPPPPYFSERKEVQALYDGVASAAKRQVKQGNLTHDNRLSFRKLFDGLPPTNPQVYAPSTAPRTIAETGDSSFVSDEAFAWQRIAGANPMRISRVGSTFSPAVPAGFSLTDAEVRTITHYTLAQLRDAKRLYVCDYRQVGTLLTEFGKSSSAKLATVGLFYLADPPATSTTRRPPTPAPPGAAMKLMPLAILLLEPGHADRTIKPGDADWNLAKLVLQSNDAVVHELKYHLWNSHFAMEPVVLSMLRQLDEWHPLRELLVRHTYGLLWINNYGFSQLVNPGGYAEQLLGMSLDGVAKGLSLAQDEWSWDTTRLKSHLDARGLDALPTFPYRDDARRLHDAVRTFTGEYVALYYDNDAEVARDRELLEWLKEMKQFGVNGLPELSTKSGLADFVADLIFQMSVQHAAVNTPQWDYIAYSLNMPGYLQPLSQADAAKPADQALVARLPALGDAISWMELMGKLAGYFAEPGGLGHYRDFWSPNRSQELKFSDKAADEALLRFRAALVTVETAIQVANQTRARPYDCLSPQRLDNSTHK